MLNFNSVIVGSSNPKELALFYKKVLGKEPDMADGEWFGFMVGSAFLTIGPHSEISGKAKEPQRILLNFETREVDEEFERIKAAGAEVIKQPYEPKEAAGMKIATFADLDGNFFQLMTPFEG